MRLRLSWMCADACAAPVTRPRRRRPPRPRQSLPSQVDRPMPASWSPPEYPSHPPGFANGAGRLCNPAIAPSKLDQGLQNWDKFTSVSWYPHKHHSKPKSKAGPYKLHPKFPKILFRPGRLGIITVRRPHRQRMSSAANALLCNIGEGKHCNLLSYFSALQHLCGTRSCGKRARKGHFHGHEHTCTHTGRQSAQPPTLARPESKPATSQTFCAV